MADKKEKALTRDNVLKLIEKNGGKAEGLDLSRKEFESGIDLSKLRLSSIILEEAFLAYAHLEGADLTFAHLEGAYLQKANLEEAYLAWASLDRANLTGASLKGAWLDRTSFIGAYLIGVEFSPDTKWGNIDWGNYILGEEADGFFFLAEDTYRRLKVWHTNAGIYDMAAEFFFREMTAKRKAMKWWPNPLLRAWSKFLSILCGYGEKWHRVIISAVAVILGLAAAYYFWGSFSSSSFWDTLYYSAASFTALGYGQWAPQPTGWAKGVGAAEAVIGVFMMALFLITFVRKMTR